MAGNRINVQYLIELLNWAKENNYIESFRLDNRNGVFVQIIDANYRSFIERIIQEYPVYDGYTLAQENIDAVIAQIKLTRDMNNDIVEKEKKILNSWKQEAQVVSDALSPKTMETPPQIIKTANSECTVIKIPYVHTNMDVDDIDPENNKVFTDEQIQAIKALDLPLGRVSRKKLVARGLDNIPFGIEIHQDANDPAVKHYFAVYSGVKKGKHLGSGHFGSVKLMQNLETGEVCALKIIKKSGEFRNIVDSEGNPIIHKIPELKPHPKERDHFITERAVLKATGRLIAGWDRTDHGKNQYELIMKLGKGKTIQAMIDSEEKISTAQRIDISLGMLQATMKVHEKGFIHRDIKPTNMIYDSDTGEVTLVDVGVAIPDQNLVRTPGVGTPGYIAKECMSGNYQIRSDVYSLGVCIAQELGLGSLKNNKFVLVDRIENDPVREHMRRYLQLMTDQSAFRRPYLAEAIDFFKTARELYLDTPSRIKEVAFVDVAEFKNEDSKRAIFKGLRGVNEVVLIDSGNHSKKDYQKIKQELERLGIGVSSDLVKLKPEAKNEALQAYAFEREKNSPNALFKCNYVNIKGVQELIASPDQEKVQYFKMVDELRNQYFKIKEELDKEQKRLSEKYDNSNESKTNTSKIAPAAIANGKKRMELIQGASKNMHNIFEGKDKVESKDKIETKDIAARFSKFVDELKKLEHDLQAKSSLSNLTQKIFGRAATKTHKVIKSIREATETTAKMIKH